MANDINNDLISELAANGVLFGHKKSKTHPKMKPFIAANKNEIEVLNPESTLEGLKTAIDALNEKIKAGGLVLLVGTQPVSWEAIKKFAGEFNFPYIIKRWLGGTVTNFKMINQRILHYQDLKLKKEQGEFAKYTKKEQSKINEKISKMTASFGGLVNLTRIPDIIFIVDIKIHDTAIKEAKKIGIPVVALLDSDDDPTLVEYPIFASDHSKSSITWIIDKIIEGIKKA